jgi:hypothetical protein
MSRNDRRLSLAIDEPVAEAHDQRGVSFLNLLWLSTQRDDTAILWAEFTVTFEASATSRGKVPLELAGEGFWP